MSVMITEKAAAEIKRFISEQSMGDEALLRIGIAAGGCSGFQYGFEFDEEQKADDIVVERDGVTMLVDGMSLLYLMGSEVDFVEDLVGASFQVVNPNATANCGCGSSFSI